MKKLITLAFLLLSHFAIARTDASSKAPVLTEVVDLNGQSHLDADSAYRFTFTGDEIRATARDQVNKSFHTPYRQIKNKPVKFDNAEYYFDNHDLVMKRDSDREKITIQEFKTAPKDFVLQGSVLIVDFESSEYIRVGRNTHLDVFDSIVLFDLASHKIIHELKSHGITHMIPIANHNVLLMGKLNPSFVDVRTGAFHQLQGSWQHFFGDWDQLCVRKAVVINQNKTMLFVFDTDDSELLVLEVPSLRQITKAKLKELKGPRERNIEIALSPGEDRLFIFNAKSSYVDKQQPRPLLFVYDVTALK